jgi:DNA-directed RNA polymerase subunit F
MELLSYKHLTYSEVARLLKKLIDSGEKVSHMVSRVYEYVSKLSKCSGSDEVISELTSRLGLKEITAVMLVNNCPNNVDEVRIYLNFEGKTFDENSLNEIVNILSKCCTE